MDGSGLERAPDATACWSCASTGFCVFCAGNGRYIPRGTEVLAECRDCGGSGSCAECRGTGYVARDDEGDWPPFDGE
jgi:hypothetical protein